jgi:glycosyltransferase involved in cell wall biosynthesis
MTKAEIYKKKLKDLNVVVILPTYNNANTIASIIEDVAEYASDIIVVNDGSTDNTSYILEKNDFINIVSYPKNKGKGIALKQGFEMAQKGNFRYAITIDTDGQHFANDIPSFIDKITESPDSLLIGARDLSADNMPSKNSFANKFSNFWYKAETGIALEDTQSGFRLYPLEKIKDFKYVSSKYEFELEVMVYAAWKNINVENITIQVYYPKAEDRVSHFRPFKDFTRISILNTYLVTLALLWYWPKKFILSLTLTNLKNFFYDKIINSTESDKNVALSIGLGSFFGIAPIWGFQMLVAGVVAHLLKQNKVITIFAANISLPPLIPFILYAGFAVGGFLLDKPTDLSFSNVSLESVQRDLVQYLVGSIVLAISYGLFMTGLSYLLLKIFRNKK